MAPAEVIPEPRPLAARLAGWRERLSAALGRASADPHSRRGRRVVLLFALASVLYVADLTFTLSASQHRCFFELNPIAAPLIGNAPALIAFKMLIWLFASLVILTYRRRLVTEVGCWGVCAVYAVLTGVWHQFFLALS